MKKAIIYGMSLALILSMTACGGSNENAADKSQETSTPEVTQPVESSTPEITATPEQTTQTAPETTPTPESVSTPAQENITAPQENDSLFTETDETLYATTTVNVRSSYSTNSDKLGSLTKAQSVKRTGIGTGAAAGWSRIEFNGKVAYVSSDYLSATKPQVSTGSNGGSSSGQTSKPSSKPSTGGNSGSSSSSSGGSSGSTAPVPPGGSGSSGGSNIGDLDMDELNDWFNDESQSGGWGSLEDSNHGFDPVDTQ